MRGAVHKLREADVYVQDVLTKERIKDCLATNWIAREVVCLQTTVSTNLDAKRLIEEGGKDGTLVLAEQQTKGRGRRGRTWESKPGHSIYMSLALKPEFEPDKASMLTLVMAYAVAKAIRRVSGLKVQIKWPNDIVLNGRKVCGILTEMHLVKSRIQSVIIGVGINVNQTMFADEIKDLATSLFLEGGCKIARAELVAWTMKYFEEVYEQFLFEQNLDFLKKGYEDMLVNRNKEVRVLEPQGEYEGVALGISGEGELIVQKKDGKEVCVYAGEVSVRGIYGYV